MSSFEVGAVQEAEAVGPGDVVDMSLPEAEAVGQDSMIRHTPQLNTQDQVEIQAELESRRHRHRPVSDADGDFVEQSAEQAEDEEMPVELRRSRRTQIADDDDAATTPIVDGSTNRWQEKGGGLLIGGFLGLLFGAGAFGGVWYAKLLPANPESLFGDTNGDTAKQPGQPAVIPKEQVIAATPALGRQFLEAGDMTKAIDTFAKCEKTVPALAGLGQAKWLAYVQDGAGKNQPLKRDDPKVTEAIADLDAAGSAYGNDPKKETELEAVRAALWRGLIEESLGNFDAAARIYTKAAGEYKDHSAVFTTAQKRVDALRPAAKTVGRAIHPHEALMAFLVMLQRR